MYISLDMGTSNTRLWLCDEQGDIDCLKGNFGAGTTKSLGKEKVFEMLRSLLKTLLDKNHIEEKNIEFIIASGMAGSELGIKEIPHIELPADEYKLTRCLEVHCVSEITEIPFWFVPGLKKSSNNKLVDIMRGEEVEAVGLMRTLSLNKGFVLLLPGTHNKAIAIDSDGQIVDFYTTMSGEILNSIIEHTILKGEVGHDFVISECDVWKGARCAREKGFGAALFQIRIMSKNGVSRDLLSSFLYGAVIGLDIDGIQNFASGKPIFVGGREQLKRVYQILLGDQAELLRSEDTENAVKNGLTEIHRLAVSIQKREEIIQCIEKEKIIAIVRNPKEENFLEAMEALYRGGIRLIEVTFDRSGKFPKEKTAEYIRKLKEQSLVQVGAGTVTSREEVLLACEAGAAYIISPNCDPEIIRLTRKLGLVSIPAAYTPTEVAMALNAGADFIKLFPVNQMSMEYVKAFRAPLSDAKLLAVGGVDENNMQFYLQNGFTGVGIGSNLYDSNRITTDNLEQLENLAKTYVKNIV